MHSVHTRAPPVLRVTRQVHRVHARSVVVRLAVEVQRVDGNDANDEPLGLVQNEARFRVWASIRRHALDLEIPADAAGAAIQRRSPLHLGEPGQRQRLARLAIAAPAVSLGRGEEQFLHGAEVPWPLRE